MSYALNDLDEDEVSWLRKLSDGRVHVLPTAMAERLQSLGLATQTAPASAEQGSQQLDQGALGTRINAEGLELLNSEE